MFGDIAPEDRIVTPHEVHKRFTVTYYNNVDILMLFLKFNQFFNKYIFNTSFVTCI